MLRIGLSGGIGAGKSTVSSTFSDLGGIVVDGDVISREVVEPGTEGLAKLVEAFGEQILSGDGSLNRPALAAIAFSDDEKRQTLNGIVHPLVAERRSELIASAVKARKNPVIVSRQTCVTPSIWCAHCVRVTSQRCMCRALKMKHSAIWPVRGQRPKPILGTRGNG